MINNVESEEKQRSDQATFIKSQNNLEHSLESVKA